MFAALPFLAMTLSVNASERTEIVDRAALRVCADPAALPFSNQDGRGFENQIAELFAKDLGVEIKYIWFPSTIGFFRRTLNARHCDIVIGAATGIETAQSTIPYYRSTYVLVTRQEDLIQTTTLDDPSLHAKRIGVQTSTPPADILARAGMLENMHSYNLMVDSRHTSVGQQLIDDLVAKRIDAAVIWGPIGAYFANRADARLVVTPLTSGRGNEALAFDVGMAVRFGEPAWRARIDRFIRERHREIIGILAVYKIPLLPIETAK